MAELVCESEEKARAPAGAELESLSRRLRPPLLRFFLRRTGSRWDAEDLVQELFLRLHRQSELDSLSNRDGYIFQAAANLLRDKVREDKVRAADKHEDASDHEFVSKTPSPEDALLAKQRLQLVLAGIDTLSPRTRAVLMLRRYEGMSHAHIARQLGISVSAVEKHLARAVEALRVSVARFE